MMMRNAGALAAVLVGLATVTACLDSPSPGASSQCCQANTDCADGFGCTNGVCAPRCQTSDTCSFSQVCSAATHTCIPAHAIPNPCGNGTFGNPNPVTSLDGSTLLDGATGMDVPIVARDASSEDHVLPPDDGGIPDAARPDAARPDAGLPDAARPDASRPDASQPDAAPPPDSGPPLCDGLDLFEPNNTQAQASQLNGDVAQGVLCGPDQDWFVVNSNPGDNVTVSLTTSEDAPIQMLLTAQNGPVVGQGMQSGPRSWSLFASAPNRTFLQITTPFPSNVHYNVRVTVTPQNTCSPDAFEPNEQQVGAPLVRGPIVASLCTNDTDWFTVLVSDSGMTITVDMSPAPGAGDLELELVAPDGTQLTSSTNPQGSPEHIDMVLQQPGAYAVHVYPFQGGVGQYTLSVDVRPGGNTCVDDGFEPNDSTAFPSDALPLSGSQNLQGTLCPGNPDVYRLRIPQVGPLSVDMVANGGPVQVQLVAASGQVVAQDINDGSGMNLTRVSVQANAGDVFFVRLDGLMTSAAGVNYFVIASVGAQCGVDGNEPNDSQFEPTEVNGSIRGVTCGGDDDWFYTLGNPGDDVTATINLTGPGLILEIWDLGPAGAFLAATGVPLPGGMEARWRDTQGALLIRVSGQGTLPIPYNLTVTRGGTSNCNVDFFEPNENRQSATPYNNPVNGFICAGDRDFFQVNVPSAMSLLTVDLQPQGGGNGGDLNVRIYDPSGALLGQGNMPAGVPERVSVPANFRGPYFVEVYGAPENSMNAGTGGYFLQVTVQGTMGCQDDFFEPNNTAQAASQLGVVPITVQATLCPNDRDHYAVQVSSGETLTVNLDYTPPRMRLTLFNTAGTQLGDSNTGSGFESITVANLAAGTYILRVQGSGMGGTQGRPYQLSATTSGGQCMGDFGEPNDDVNTASPVMTTGTISAVMCGVADVDFYTFVSTPGRTEEVTIVPTSPMGVPLDVIILDPFQNQVASSIGQPGPLKVARADITQPGPYFVEVINTQGTDAQFPYTLVFRDVVQAVCLDDSAEPNNTAQQAALRTTNVDIIGIACPANLDFYAFDLRANVMETITLTNNSPGDGLFELLDTNGASVLAQGFANFQPISFRVPRNGRYFVRITYGMAPSQGDRYVLRVNP